MTLSISAELSRPYLPAGESGEITHGQISIDPGFEQANVIRQVILCIDTSMSMKGERIEMAKEGAKYAAGALNDDDYLGIIGFNSAEQVMSFLGLDRATQTVLEPARWGDLDRDQVHGSIDEMSVASGTDIESGLRRANQAFNAIRMPATNKQVVRRIILLSDGKDNQKSAAEFEEIVEDITDEQTSIMAAGIGEYDEATIKTIGTAGTGGKWRHLTDAKEIRDFLSEEVNRASTVIQTSPKLRFETTDGTELRTTYRCAPQVQEVDIEWDGSTAVVTLPDLHEQERQLVVFELAAPEGELGETRKLADVYFEGEQAEPQELVAEYTDDPDLLSQVNRGPMVNFGAAEIIEETVARDEPDVEGMEEEIEKLETVAGEDADLVDTLRDQKSKIEAGEDEAGWETSMIIAEETEEENDQ